MMARQSRTLKDLPLCLDCLQLVIIAQVWMPQTISQRTKYKSTNCGRDEHKTVLVGV